MIKLLKEALSVWILRNRIETIDKCLYAAVAYSNEQKIKGNAKSGEDLVFEYLQLVLPGISREDAMKHADAMKSRLLFVGANPQTKL